MMNMCGTTVLSALNKRIINFCFLNLNKNPSRGMGGVVNFSEDALQEKSLGPFSVIKLNFKDNFVSKSLGSLKSKKGRTESGLILLEGKRLIKDAISAGHLPKMIFFTRTSDLNQINVPHTDDEIKAYKCSYKDLQLWSNLSTSPGILGVFEKPSSLPETKKSVPVTVVCDEIREPGNLGALLRTSAGIPVRRVLLVKGCTDLWDTKVLRGGSGAHFRVPLYPDLSWEEINEEFKGCQVLLATSESSFDKSPHISYNSLPIESYSDVKLQKDRQIVVVIGGETGLSLSAYQFAFNNKGSGVTIPLTNGMDSLNCVSAASVIIFEIRRRLQNDA